MWLLAQWVDEDDEEGDEKKEDFDVSSMQGMQNVSLGPICAPPPLDHCLIFIPWRMQARAPGTVLHTRGGLQRSLTV